MYKLIIDNKQNEIDNIEENIDLNQDLLMS